MSTLLPIYFTVFLKLLNNMGDPGPCSAARTEIHRIHGGFVADVVASIGSYAYFAEPGVKYVASVSGTIHPGAEHALWGRVVSDVLCAGRPVVAEVGYAGARAFVFSFGVMREVVALDHVLGMRAGGSLEGRTNAESPQGVVSSRVVVQGEQTFLLGMKEDLTPSALAHVASARRAGGRVQGAQARGDTKDDGKDHRQMLHNFLPLLYRHSACRYFSCRSCTRRIVFYESSLPSDASLAPGSDRMR